MFDRIAPRYDLLNRVLSAGIDVRWRKRALRMLADALQHAHGRTDGLRLLDVATGTADLAIESVRLRPAEVVGVDPSEGMLRLGQEKVDARNLSGLVSLRVGASEALPFEDGHFDGALVAFGVRNFEDRIGGLREIARVLKPGSPLVVLEFSQPRGPVAPLFGFYFRQLLPKIGGLVSGDGAAYGYLHDSVQAFPEGEAFLAELGEAGFEPRRHERLTFGIASLYVGTARP
jgi:demethylmenaquinone methyltransferase / 2-methoxy-6-polyprenyl-1,4-benzoquinol methylase